MGEPNSTVTTDASMEGWGAHSENVEVGGRWLLDESKDHINVLELRAIFLALQSLVYVLDDHVRILTDHTTAMAYIRNMGGTRCNAVAKQIWEWAQHKHVWLGGTTPGTHSIIADRKSRRFHDHLEWSLNNTIFQIIFNQWGTPDVDLFASWNNRKLEKYVSWHPEPESWRIDAFSLI